MAKIFYARVSTKEQNLDRQIEKAQELKVDKIYQEKISGKAKENRVELNKMLDYVRENDTIYVMDFSRLARNTKDLLDITELLKAKGVNLVSLKENIDTSTSTGELMLTMIGAIYQFERECIHERQLQGIAIAKEKGVYKGRKPKEVDENFISYYEMYLNREIKSKTELAKKLNISRVTLDKMIKEYDNK